MVCIPVIVSGEDDDPAAISKAKPPALVDVPPHVPMVLWTPVRSYSVNRAGIEVMLFIDVYPEERVAESEVLFAKAATVALLGAMEFPRLAVRVVQVSAPLQLSIGVLWTIGVVVFSPVK